MRFVHSIFLADPSPFPQQTAPHTAGWLRWYVLSAIIIVALMAFVCLRGYRNRDSDGE